MMNRAMNLLRRARLRAIGARGAMVALGLAVGLGAGQPVGANPFAPVIRVNDRAVTQYELDQRLLFLQILRQPGDLPALARSGLIEDRLRMIAGEEFAIKVTPEQIMEGMTEFAGRANLSAEEFTKIVGQMGLDPEAFRDFVEAGMVWREVVRAKYAGKITITEAEIDRAIETFQPTSAVKLQLSEIVLTATGNDQSAAVALARRLQAQITTEADFNAAARANGGGPLGWKRLSDLPVEARETLSKLAPGTMSVPVRFADRVVIYWVSERGEDALSEGSGIMLDYAQYLVPEGPNAAAELAAVRARVDTCNDLYAVAKGLPADRLTREVQPIGAVGGDIGAVLATLDAGESSTAISRGGWRVFLMLCTRGPAADLVLDRASISQQLLNQRLGSLAEIYLEELRAEAVIIEE